jgi:hypothetical protein
MIEQSCPHAAPHLPGCFGEIELGSLAQNSVIRRRCASPVMFGLQAVNRHGEMKIA